MKGFNEFINESQEQSKLGKKILNLLSKDTSDIVTSILKKTEKWDENKFDWSREPMFLIADEDSKINIDNGEWTRNLVWVRKKFFNVLDDGNGIQGTLENYNIADDIGRVPKSVLGIYFDRQFYPITSLDVYKKIRQFIEEQE